jgi:hypothetical protein
MAVNIDAGSIPAFQAASRKGMANIVDARVAQLTATAPAKSLTQLLEGILNVASCRRSAAVEDKERVGRMIRYR